MHNYKRRKVQKGLWGLQFSSSPLTSLNPGYSANLSPNYNNAFQFKSLLQLNPSIQLSWNLLDNDFLALKFKMGLELSTSNNASAKQYGQQLVLERLDDINSTSFDQGQPVSNGSGFDWSKGFSAASLVGDKIGGTAGKTISGLANVGGSVASLLREKRVGAKPTGVAGAAGGISTKAGNVAGIVGAASDLIGSFMPEKTEYSGTKGDITLTMDTVYDGISDAAMSFGPVGMMVGGIMKGGALLGKGVNALGGGTDGMTTTDAILGSSFLNLTPIGLINGFGGLKADTITKNELAFETVGASYSGTGRTVDDALLKSGKKYGLLSNSARKKANEEILEAKRLLEIMEDIADEATDRRALRNSMSAINGNRRKYYMQGGYDQAAIRAGRHGMVLLDLYRARRIIGSMKYLNGGKVEDPFEHYLQTLPEYLRNSSNFRVRDYWEFNGKPKDFDEAIFKGMFTEYEDGWHANSVAENPKTGEIEFMKSSSHPSIQKELDWYNSDDASLFRSEYELQKTEPYYKYVRRKTTDSPLSYKNGGSLDVWLVETSLDDIPTEFREFSINEVSLDALLPEFREGGKFNVIPEGALHARKNNMDIEGITKKGIPVVSESEGGLIELHAEIERSEIIFRLEVTQKLEELAKDGSDEAAIEAGKLLTEEILYNTIDNTNSLI